MQYILNYQAFMQLPYTSGTVQNLCKRAPVEVSDSATPDSGILLKPGESFYFKNATVFARSGWDGGEHCKIAVLPIAGGGGGDGGSSDGDDPVATDSDIQEIIDDYYGS